MAVLDMESSSRDPQHGRNPSRSIYFRLFGAMLAVLIVGSLSTIRSNVNTHQLTAYLRPIEEGAQKALEPPKEGEFTVTAQKNSQDEERVTLEEERTKEESATGATPPTEENNDETVVTAEEPAADVKPQKEQKQNTRETTQEQEAAKPSKPLNILLLYADDWRHDTLGVAGTQIVKTPYLDQLSREGVRFTYNCVTTSVCWISRATLYSGQYLSRHKSDNIDNPQFLKGWNDSFPQLLRDNGYYTGHVGKWHFTQWDEFARDKFDSAKAYYGEHWIEEGGTKIHTTKKNAMDSLEFLQNRPKDSPFCLMVCFFAPHAEDGNPDQYLPQNHSMSLYVDEVVEVPKTATDEYFKRLPSFFNEYNEGRNRYLWRFDTPEKHQTMMKNYYRLISDVDEASGRIIQELDKQGILNETLIIFTTDNGYFHAEHGLADKWYPHQESIRVPLIIKDPRMPKEFVGKENDDFTLNIDLAPTILGAANIAKPDSMQGRDITEIYRNKEEMTPWRTEFFYEHPVHRDVATIPASEALVRKDHKYMLWPNHDVEQFFDLANDPLEENDLIKDESKQELIASMRTRFAELKELAK